MDFLPRGPCLEFTRQRCARGVCNPASLRSYAHTTQATPVHRPLPYKVVGEGGGRGPESRSGCRQRQSRDSVIRLQSAARLLCISARVLCVCEQAERVLLYLTWNVIGCPQENRAPDCMLPWARKKALTPSERPGKGTLPGVMYYYPFPAVGRGREVAHPRKSVIPLGIARARSPTNIGRLVPADRYCACAMRRSCLFGKRPGGPDRMVPTCGSLGQRRHGTSPTSLSPLRPFRLSWVSQRRRHARIGVKPSRQ